MDTFKLLFLAPKEDEAVGAVAHVQVQVSASIEYYGVLKEGLLTNRCMTYCELDEEIERLKRELDKIKKRAKAKFAEDEALVW